MLGRLTVGVRIPPEFPASPPFARRRSSRSGGGRPCATLDSKLLLCGQSFCAGARLWRRGEDDDRATPSIRKLAVSGCRREQNSLPIQCICHFTTDVSS